MLAYDRIEFRNFYFLRLGALILGSGVEMAGSGRRFELYFFSHDNVLIFPSLNAVSRLLNVVPACAHSSQHRVNTIFVYCTERYIRQAQADPAMLALNPEPAALQIGQKAPFGLVVSMGNVVAGHRLLSGDFTYLCHGDPLPKSEKSTLYPDFKDFLKSYQSALSKRHGRARANDKMIEDLHVYQSKRLF